jgi:hypothetical protein
MTDEFWYRFEDVAYTRISDPERETWNSTLEIELLQFRVVRHTPKGAWITRALDRPFADLRADHDLRFVLRDARKRFACPTIDEARASFVARKRAQIRIYNARLRRAQQALALLEMRWPPPKSETPRSFCGPSALLVDGLDGPALD